MSRSSPFFRSPFYGNSYPGRNAAYFSPPSPPPPAKPKVVPIPVHFVGSDDNNNKKKKIKPTGPSPAAAAAIRIQSTFRGFLVRKNVKVVGAIGAEVDDIEMRFRRGEKEMDSIGRDEKERLKINEMLIRLLFRLDSVRGVRDYRKRVIRRVIAIQEMLDSIAAAVAEDQTLGEVEALENTGDRVPETTEMVQDSKPDEVETVEETAGLKEESKPDVVIEESKTLENGDQGYKPDDDEAETPETAGDHISNGWAPVDGNLATAENQESVMDAEEVSPEIPESSVDPEKEGDLATAENQESVMDAEEVSPEILESSVDPEKEGDLATAENQESVMEAEEVSPEITESSVDDSKKEEVGTDETATVGMKDAMERMVVENEKLKGLVVELCERSAQQCRLMCGLAERVEHLEKIVEKMERSSKKKKRKDSSSPASSVDKKCGREG